jgi:uncharacterized protein
MALVNQAKREINAKIVFFGPGLAGKSTNLKHVHGKLKPEFRGIIKAMSVQDARMLFFDFTPPGDGNVHGFRVRFHVYTVSGLTVDPAAWKMVLKGVDGVVFVADAAPERAAANRESLDDLVSFLKGYGQSLASIPVVFQYNKSELPNATSVSDLERTLNPSRLPSFKASSQNGEGVLQTLLSLVKAVLNELRGKGLEGIGSAEGLQAMVETPAAAETVQPRAPQPPPAAQRAEAPVARASQAAQAAPETRIPETRIPETRIPETRAPVAAVAEELSLELAGAPQAAGPGLFRLPLTIRSGARTKSVVLSIALSLEEG